MRVLAVAAAFLALLAQPVLAQDLNKQTAPAAGKQTSTATVNDSDPARVAEARRLTAEALAADAAIKARNEAERANFSAASADYRARLAAQQAAEAKYKAELAAQQEAAAQYDRDHAAWEARVKACRGGDYSQCGDK